MKIGDIQPDTEEGLIVRVSALRILTHKHANNHYLYGASRALLLAAERELDALRQKQATTAIMEELNNMNSDLGPK